MTVFQVWRYSLIQFFLIEPEDFHIFIIILLNIIFYQLLITEKTIRAIDQLEHFSVI